MKFGGGTLDDAETDKDNDNTDDGDNVCHNEATAQEQVKRLHTPDQGKRAECACNPFDAVGPMTTENFKAALRTNVTHNMKIVTQGC